MYGILAFSAILWVFLDRAKKLWAQFRWGKWVTTLVSAAAGLLLAFAYGLDLLLATGLTEGVSWGGQVFAGLAVAAGSSCIHEVLDKVQRQGE